MLEPSYLKRFYHNLALFSSWDVKCGDMMTWQYWQKHVILFTSKLKLSFCSPPIYRIQILSLKIVVLFINNIYHGRSCCSFANMWLTIRCSFFDTTKSIFETKHTKSMTFCILTLFGCDTMKMRGDAFAVILSSVTSFEITGMKWNLQSFFFGHWK